MKNDQGGFVALLSVLIVGAILSTFVFTLGIATFFSRASALDAEDKRMSLELAQGCVNVAALKLAQNHTYTPTPGGDCISVGGVCGAAGEQKTCTICHVLVDGSSAVIKVRAKYSRAFTNLVVTIRLMSGNSVVTDWGQVSTYAGPGCVIH